MSSRRKRLGSSMMVAVLSSGSWALAQEEVPAATQAPAPLLPATGSEPTPSLGAADPTSASTGDAGAPAPATPASDAAPTTPSPTSNCVVATLGGIDPGDAETAAALVCDEIAARGPRAGRRYSVAFGRLGERVVLSLREETPQGTTTRYERLVLANIEEVPVAAPRLVQAVLEGVPIEKTERVDSVVGPDADEPPQRTGHTLTEVGSVVMFSGAAGPDASVGLSVGIAYDTPHLGIGFAGRFAAVTDEQGLGMFAVGPFVRWYPTTADIAPYLGGGTGPMMMSFRDGGRDGEAWGAGFWVEGGAELLRVHRSHLMLGARVELPMFVVEPIDAASMTASEGSSVYPVAAELLASYRYSPRRHR